MDIVKRIRFWLCAVAAVLLHNVIHESIHYATALALGEGVEEFRLLTNGWLTSQVIFATPVAERAGAHWLVISWLPAVVTVALGFAIYFSRKRLLGPIRWLNTFWWYAGFFFLFIDPFYFALLSLVVGGDIQAAAAVGWPEWPARVAAFAFLVTGIRLMWRWKREAAMARELY